MIQSTLDLCAKGQLRNGNRTIRGADLRDDAHATRRKERRLQLRIGMRQEQAIGQRIGVARDHREATGNGNPLRSHKGQGAVRQRKEQLQWLSRARLCGQCVHREDRACVLQATVGHTYRVDEA